jgi:hypothetical protein
LKFGQQTTPKKVSGADETKLFPLPDLSSNGPLGGVQKGYQFTKLLTKKGANSLELQKLLTGKPFCCVKLIFMGPEKPHGIHNESGVILPIIGVDPHICVHCA